MNERVKKGLIFTVMTIFVLTAGLTLFDQLQRMKLELTAAEGITVMTMPSPLTTVLNSHPIAPSATTDPIAPTNAIPSSAAHVPTLWRNESSPRWQKKWQQINETLQRDQTLAGKGALMYDIPVASGLKMIQSDGLSWMIKEPGAPNGCYMYPADQSAIMMIIFSDGSKPYQFEWTPKAGQVDLLECL